ncbi:MAG TPA: DUF502 domain-containing protein [bacterium]|nr:DUF502 domain-containing protein [bacterium]
MKHVPFTKGSTLKTLRGHFFAGLVALAPLFITVWMLLTIFNYLDARIRGYFMELFNLQVPPYGAGVLVTFLGIVFVGMVARNFIGGRILQFFEGILLKVPVANRLYGAVKQIIGAFVGRDKTVFEKVVLVQYPRQGCYCLGFLTYPEQIRFRGHDNLPELLCIFVPTTPNPTSGMLLLFPEEQVQILSINIEDGLKMIISGGVVLPESVAPCGEPGSLSVQDGKRYDEKPNA